MSAEELGYAVGVILSPFLIAFVGVAIWGAWTAEDGRLRSGIRYAFHLRTLAVAGFLWLAGALGRVVGA